MLLLCVILVTLTTSQLVAGAILTCEADATTMTMTITAAEVADSTVGLLAVDIDNNYISNDCSSTSFVDAGGLTQHSLVVTVSLLAGVVQAQTVPVLLTNNCYVKIETTTTQATLSVLARTSLTTILSTNIVHTPATCDSATATDNTVTLNLASVTINTLANNPLVASFGTVALTIADAADLAIDVPIPTIGQSVKLLATYTRASSDGTSELFVHLYDVEVSNNAAFTHDLNTFMYVDAITDANGCRIAASDFVIATSFLNTDANPATIATSVPETSSATGQMSIVVFATSPSPFSAHTLFFRGKYTLCYTAEDKCVNQDAHCATLAGKRRRRSAEQGNSTQVLRVDVSMSGKGTTLNLGGDGAGTNDEFVRECQEATKFWIAAIVMGILLLIVLVFAVFLFYKLQNQRRHNHKAESTYGVQNPSY